MAVKIKLSTDLLERLDALAEKQGLSRQAFLQQAIENEVLRCEREAVREDIALLELERNLVEGGQSLTVPLEGYSDALTPGGSHCELCLAEIGPLPPTVDGPHFCEECLALAKGGDFSRLEPGP